MNRFRKVCTTLCFCIQVLLPTYLATADGGYFSARSVALSADQRAILIKNGNEISLTLSTGYTGDGEEFGWLIPTPVPPEIEDVIEAGRSGEKAFELLDEYSAPRIVTHRDYGCFPAGTEVLTAAGPRAIESIETGVEVYAYDLATGQWVLSPVTNHRSYCWEGEMVSIRAGEISVDATGNHPFFVISGDNLPSRPVPRDIQGEVTDLGSARWVEARDLRPGDLLKTCHADQVRIISVSSRRQATKVFNLEVERCNTYAVGRYGTLVHNKGRSESEGQPNALSLVTVYGTATLETYSVSVVGAAEAGALLSWLRSNGFRVDQASQQVLDSYIDEGWAFVAVKLNPAERRRFENEFSPPLTIRYRANRIVFPLRISSISTVDTARITLYVLAENTVRAAIPNRSVDLRSDHTAAGRGSRLR